MTLSYKYYQHVTIFTSASQSNFKHPDIPIGETLGEPRT